MKQVAKKVASGTSNESNITGVISKALSGMVEAQKVALGRVPLEHMGVMQIAFIIAMVALPMAFLFIYQGHENIAGSLAAAGLLGLFSGMYFLRPFSKPQTRTSKSSSGEAAGVWARITLRQLPLQERRRISSKLEDLLEKARVEYFRLLQTRQTALQGNADDIRINIFLPDTSKVEFGEVCGLSIPEQLHQGMIDPTEIRVRFRPSEGLTGRVFASFDKAYGACRDSADSEWSLVKLGSPGANVPDGFGMTLDQINQINSKIRWIVSFPLIGTYNDEKHVFGVLNLDGLNVPLAPSELTTLWQLLADGVALLAEQMFKSPKSLTLISVTDVDG